MKNKSRIENSSRNFKYGMLSQILNLMLKFVVRTIFIRALGKTYLGINGLYSNILTILSLAECGFGTAIVFNMYKPLAEKDESKLIALMQLYKKVYTIVGTIVLFMGLLITPALKFIIKDAFNVDHLYLYYFMFLGDTVLSYLFFSYKSSILNADQKSFIISLYTGIFNVAKSVMQILVIIIFKNFILYLIMQLFFTFLTNIGISLKVDKEYPYLKTKEKYKLDKGELGKIIKNVEALILSNISRVVLNGTDNIIISAYVGVAIVGKYSNYTLITGSLVMILSQISEAVRASVGNFIASKEQNENYQLFRKIDFMNFWLYGFSMIALIVLFNPFISLWIGEDLLLSETCAVVIAVNFFIEGMLNSLWIFRTTLGLFTQGKWRSVFAAIINLVGSLILAKYMGILGILLATTASRVLVNMWYDPYIIFKHGLNHPVKSYYIEYILRIILLLLIIVSLLLLRHFILLNGITIGLFAILMIITAFVPNFVFLIIFHRTEEYKYFKNILFSAIRNRLHFNKNTSILNQ